MESLWSVSILVLLSTLVICATAGLLELPLATSESGLLSFWTSLNASCDMKFLEDNMCCLDSTFKDASESQHLLQELLQDVPDGKYEVHGVAQLLYKASNGLQVGTRYMCDMPVGGNDVPGISCHRCLDRIVDEITGGMSETGRCRNAWALRFGLVYEPNIPWEDSTWCHLDYWFRVLPSSPRPHFKFWNSFRTISSQVKRLVVWYASLSGT